MASGNLVAICYTGGALRPNKNDRTNRTMKTKNRIFAISIAVPASTPKPSTAAMSAIIRNVMAQEIMFDWFLSGVNAFTKESWTTLFPRVGPRQNLVTTLDCALGVIMGPSLPTDSF